MMGPCHSMGAGNMPPPEGLRSVSCLPVGAALLVVGSECSFGLSNATGSLLFLLHPRELGCYFERGHDWVLRGPQVHIDLNHPLYAVLYCSMFGMPIYRIDCTITNHTIHY